MAKWIKETDHLPVNNNLVHIKFSTPKTGFKLTGYYEPSMKVWHRQDGSVLGWAPNLEWLDESTASFTIEDMMDAYSEGYCAGEDIRPGKSFKQFAKDKYNIDL